MAVTAANTIEQAGNTVAKEVARESYCAAESQGRTTITVGVVTSPAIFISPERSLESGPESGPPSLPSLDDLPTLREMLASPDRESNPGGASEEILNSYSIRRGAGNAIGSRWLWFFSL